VNRYRFIDAERANYPIAMLCRVLAVVRASYYAWKRRGLSARLTQDAALTTQIGAFHAASRGTYGVPRIHADLRDEGTRVGRKRVWRLMRAAGLSGCQRGRRRVRTTVTDPIATPAPNVLDRDFTATGPDERWVGDITYLPTEEGWLYLAILLDLYSRRIVGWAMAEHLRTELPLAALTMALTERRPPPGQLVHHSDRGCQYTAATYQAAMNESGVTVSMSRTGNCYDNAVAESFFGTLKAELLPDDGWATHADARLAVFEWIAVFYNRRRRHSAIGQQSPVAFEAARLASRAA
jgi:transposase InsO family protein